MVLLFCTCTRQGILILWTARFVEGQGHWQLTHIRWTWFRLPTNENFTVQALAPRQPTGPESLPPGIGTTGTIALLEGRPEHLYTTVGVTIIHRSLRYSSLQA